MFISTSTHMERCNKMPTFTADLYKMTNVLAPTGDLCQNNDQT